MMPAVELWGRWWTGLNILDFLGQIKISQKKKKNDNHHLSSESCKFQDIFLEWRSWVDSRICFSKKVVKNWILPIFADPQQYVLNCGTITQSSFQARQLEQDGAQGWVRIKPKTHTKPHISWWMSGWECLDHFASIFHPAIPSQTCTPIEWNVMPEGMHSGANP